MAQTDSSLVPTPAHGNASEHTNEERNSGDAGDGPTPPTRVVPTPFVISSEPLDRGQAAKRVWLHSSRAFIDSYNELATERNTSMRRCNELILQLQGAYTEIESCESQGREAIERANKLETQLKDVELELRAELEVCDSQRRAATGRANTFYKQVKDRELELNVVNGQLSDYQNKEDEYRTTIATQLEKISNLESGQQSLEQKLREAAAYGEDADAYNASLETQIEQLNNDIQNERTSNFDLRATLKASEQEHVKSLAEEIERTQKASAETLHEELGKKDKEMAKVQKESGKLEMRVDELQARNTQLQRQREEAHAAGGKANQDRDQAVLAKSKALDTLNQRDIDLAQKVNELSKLSESWVRIKTELDKAVKERADVVNIATQLRKDSITSGDLITNQSRMLNNKDVEIAELRSKREVDAATIAELETYYSEILMDKKELEARNTESLQRATVAEAKNAAISRKLKKAARFWSDLNEEDDEEVSKGCSGAAPPVQDTNSTISLKQQEQDDNYDTIAVSRKDSGIGAVPEKSKMKRDSPNPHCSSDATINTPTSSPAKPARASPGTTQQSQVSLSAPSTRSKAPTTPTPTVALSQAKVLIPTKPLSASDLKTFKMEKGRLEALQKQNEHEAKRQNPNVPTGPKSMMEARQKRQRDEDDCGDVVRDPRRRTRGGDSWRPSS